MRSSQADDSAEVGTVGGQQLGGAACCCMPRLPRECCTRVWGWEAGPPWCLTTVTVSGYMQTDLC